MLPRMCKQGKLTSLSSDPAIMADIATKPAKTAATPIPVLKADHATPPEITPVMKRPPANTPVKIVAMPMTVIKTSSTI
jgi:hypothetical protein